MRTAQWECVEPEHPPLAHPDEGLSFNDSTRPGRAADAVFHEATSLSTQCCLTMLASAVVGKEQESVAPATMNLVVEWGKPGAGHFAFLLRKLFLEALR